MVNQLKVRGVSGPIAAANSHSADMELDNSEYLKITDANQTGLDITGDLTVEAWVKPESVPSANFYTIASKWSQDGSNRSWLFDYHDSDDDGNPTIRVITSSDGANSNVGEIAQDLGTGTWKHVAMVYDASEGEAEIFVDGSSIGTMTGLHTSLADTGADFRLGAIVNSTPADANFWDGKMDEVRIFNDKRTSTEISNNKDKHISGSTANLQGYWRLNNDFTDETSNGNDLTDVNTVPFSTDTPF